MIVDRLLSFHDLQDAPHGAQIHTIPPELGAELDRRHQAFVMDRREDFPSIDVVAFYASSGQERRAIGLRLDDLHGSAEDNMDSIRRTAPESWEVTARTGTM